jgi:alpha-beta hydrolase superfamily lysophospholipase
MGADGSRLQQVVGHWLPRIQTAGVTGGDAARLIAAAGEWPEWCRTWSREAERHLAEAEAAERRRRAVTAGEAYLRAALCFHFGQFMFFDDLDQKEAAARRKVEAYRRAAPLLVPPAKPIAVPYGAGALHGYLRLPARQPAPLVFIIPGSDSTKEEFASLEEHFLKRGLATLSLDGPGQGEGRSHGPLTPDWAPVFRAVDEALAGAAGLDGRIGVMGMAFGGHLALQGAHALPRLAGAVCMNGFYDLGSFWDALPEVYRANMRFALGGATVEETGARARRFTLAGVEPPACPILALHGGQDRIFPPSDAERLKTFGTRGSELVVFPEGNHVCNNIAYVYRPLIADWLAERFADTAVPERRR